MAAPDGSGELQTIWEGNIGSTYVGIWSRDTRLAVRCKGSGLITGDFDYKEVYQYPDINAAVSVADGLVSYVRGLGGK